MSPDLTSHSTPANKLTMRIVFCGVLLPLIALGVELTWNLSADIFFDPIPSWLHLVLLATVPLANTTLIYALYTGHSQHWQSLAHANALAIGVSAIYTLWYLPLLPIGVIAVIWFGIGLLLLSPLLSLSSTIRLRALLKQQSQAPSLLPGILLAFTLLTLAEIPAILTNIGLQKAVYATTAEEKLAGIRWLRRFGNEDNLLRLCYERSGMSSHWVSELFNWSKPVTLDQTRTVFYQVTGQAFNAFPVPTLQTRRSEFSNFFDQDRGGETVGQRNQDIELIASRMDGILTPQTSSGYLEWSMVFKNQARINHEGRAQILLPPGAVVSRVTLWINGEEREAAFGGRNQVRQAYQKVVSQQRDPVLVTTQGADRVLMQLFPIPAGGEMKVRIGITYPLVLSQLSQAQTQLPVLRERNFEIKTLHHVWLESKSPLQAVGMKSDTSQRFQAELSDQQLEQLVLQTSRNPTDNISWHSNHTLQQQISQVMVQQPQRMALVIDGSQSMQIVQQQIRQALAQLPASLELGLVFADDNTTSWLPLSHQDAAQKIKQFRFIGGHDNTLALSKAWQWASAKPNGVIVWVHGPQPILLNSAEALLQQQQRSPHPTKLLQLEAVPGANKLMEKLDGVIGIENLPRIGNTQQQLSQLFQQWKGETASIQITRNTIDKQSPNETDHVVRLWAAEQVKQQRDRDQAIALAQRYQLVTAVTGAVVLETQQQYQEAGLEPVAANSVPTIPEPETWLMIILVLLLLLSKTRHSRTVSHWFKVRT